MYVYIYIYIYIYVSEPMGPAQRRRHEGADASGGSKGSTNNTVIETL